MVLWGNVSEKLGCCVERPAYPNPAKSAGNALKIPPKALGSCGKLLFSEKTVFASCRAMVLASNNKDKFSILSLLQKGVTHYEESNDDEKRFYNESIGSD